MLNWAFYINGVSLIAKLAFSSLGCPVMSSDNFGLPGLSGGDPGCSVCTADEVKSDFSCDLLVKE